MTAIKFQWLYPCFRDQAIQLDQCEYSMTSGYVVIKDGGHLPEVHRTIRISQFVYIIATKFQRLCPCFRGQASNNTNVYTISV